MPPSLSAFRDSVKATAQGQWIDLLQELGGLSPDVLDGHHHPCPRCGGSDRFRLIDADAGALFCNQCFSEKNGDGISALQWLCGWSFREALEALASRLRIEKPRQRRRPDADLEFRDWQPGIVGLWARHKPGVTTEAVRANGGQLARWHGTTVVALPTLSPKRPTGKAVGWTIWNTTGGPLVLPDREPAKMLSTRGSKAGWIGTWALGHLGDDVKVIWKVEGQTDMLALWAAIPAELRAQHLVVTNSFGAGEKPQADLLAPFTGRQVAVCHDADDAGRKGSERWAHEIARVARGVRVVELPEGQDLRDWLATGHTYVTLLELLEATTPAAAAPDDQPGDDEAEEADNDPSRLAREFLRLNTVATYLDQTYCLREECWRQLLDSDFRSRVTYFLRSEFQRLCREEVTASGTREEGPPKCHKITRPLVNSVCDNVRAYSCVPADISWGSVLGRDEEGRVESGEPKQWIALKNGLLMVPAFIAGERPEAYLRPYTPAWWSLHRLPYSYDPDAGADSRPRWERFLAHNLEGDPDRILILQEWAGYCLLPDTSQQKFLVLEGEGANGKSVYCAVLEALLGPENVSHVPLEVFGERFSLTGTLGKLANIVAEVGDLDRVAEGHLKQFTSGDSMQFERKFRSPLQLRPTARLVLATNNRPRFSDRSGGLWRRMFIVPFTVSIPEDQQVRGMDDPGWWERSGEMPGIFQWALEGLVRLLHQRGFSSSRAVAEAIEDYRRETNPAREFLEERYREQSGVVVECSTVYKEYREFCQNSGYRALGSRTFGKEVRRVFPQVKRIRQGPRLDRTWIYQGVRAEVESYEFAST